MEILNNEYQDLIDYFNDCAQACYECFNECLTSPDALKRVKLVKFLMECATFCQQVVVALAINSEHAKEMALLGAHICKVCATECHRFTDDHSKMCGEVCLETAHYTVDFFKDED